MSDRLTLATERPWLVVGTDGLLAAFNDLGVLNPLDVTAAQTIGRLLGEDDPAVLLAAALTARGTRVGHVCIRLDSVRDAVVVDGQDPDEIEALPWPDTAEWTAAITSSPLVGDGTGDEPLVLEDGRLYLERYYHYEEQVADLIKSRCVAPAEESTEVANGCVPPEELEEAAAECVPPEGGRSLRGVRQDADGGRGAIPEPTRQLLDTLLTPGTRQHEAATLALTTQVTVIAGGPGTGKTHTIAAILAALAAGEAPMPTVGLCAPTGKAAARLGEAVATIAADLADARVTEALTTVEPSTIHRLLGWSWDRGRFAHHTKNRLPHDIVIVDEMSMVSLPMAAKLLAALRDDAAVVLVGDPFQLESIEAGTVLADIVGSGESSSAPISSHVVVLDRLHRFEEDSAIADFAEAVRLGDADLAVSLLQEGGDHIRWAENRDSAAFVDLWDRAVEQRTRMVELAGAGRGEEALAALGELAVLCARRRGPDGVSGYGRDLERALDERFTGLRWHGEWYPGRPVMITKNDYAQDLYNGDIGVCVETEDGLRVLFDRNETRSFQPSHLGEHTTVHAMTIHKSQGSQFDEVVVVLPAESSRLLTRELLYTAVTRARQRVRVVGTEDVVRAAVARSVQRASGLGSRLASDAGA